MKGLNDYIKELNSPSISLQKTTELLSKAGYSIDKVLQDLKQYNTELTEVPEVSPKNEVYTVLIMSKYGQEYHRFYFNNANEILQGIVKGLQKIPNTSYFDSPAHKLKREMDDAKARASGFKDSADLANAYYNK